MTRSSAYRSPPERRRLAILLLGLPLAAGAVWLAPTARHWMEDADVAALTTATGAASPGARSASPPPARTPPATAVLASPQAPPAALLSKWELDVHGDDAARRADALAGLATAPREQALPILQNLLKDGAHPDRQQVIESLAILARLQGDADERIRTAFRVEIYDGSDEATSASAQQALADLEEDLR